VSQKTVQNCFCQNFVEFPPILIIFGTEAKIMCDALIFHLTYFASLPYHVKRRCSKLLHNAESCYL